MLRTIRDVVDRYVRPALGEFADGYDLEAIAKQAFEYVPRRGGHYACFVSDEEFWKIVEANEKE